MTDRRDRNLNLNIDRPESGLPGGGSERKNEVGGSGVYPASGPYPAGHAEIRGQASWGQGERGAAGYEDHGGSALSYRSGQLLGGYSADKQTLSIQIPADGAVLQGDLFIPPELRGLVLFAHGSGSSRLSPRNRYVAGELQKAGLATLLLDLLTADEEALDERTSHLRFDIDLLAKRLLQATAWIAQQPQFEGVKSGYFGASTGAAAALVAVAQIGARNGPDIGAVVSRGGPPDLAGPALEQVQAPTLLIVGGNDTTVLEMNREAFARLACEKRLEVVPGATHLFEEPGTLEEVARLARQWFERHLGRREDSIQAA